MEDFLAKLADREVGEPPVDFTRRLHQRVNRTLLVQHLVNFFGAIVSSVPHFLRATLGWLLLTVTGKYPDRDRR